MFGVPIEPTFPANYFPDVRPAILGTFVLLVYVAVFTPIFNLIVSAGAESKNASLLILGTIALPLTTAGWGVLLLLLNWATS